MKKQRKMAAKKILVIVGPTASGKSDLAVKLAKKLKGEIISADSRQVYKGLDVGTGKITREEMKGVPHHLLDVADPRKQFSAAQWKSMAEEELRYIESRGRLPIIVGGTGFYIDALTGKALLPDVPPNKALREKLGKKTNDALFRALAKKDPRRAKTIDPNNKVRLIRALEIVEALGKVPPSPKSRRGLGEVWIGLNPPDLDTRIAKRLKARLPGMIQEATKLVKLKKLSYRRMQELGLEYKYLALYLQKKLSRKEMAQKLEIAIRQYAKRQMTWFKRNKAIRWYASADDAYRANATPPARARRGR
jgi:tRNA dimethylallyltransferase